MSSIASSNFFAAIHKLHSVTVRTHLQASLARHHCFQYYPQQPNKHLKKANNASSHTFLENANRIRNIWYVIPSSLVDRYQRVKTCCLELYRNNGGRGLLWNNGTCLTNYTESYTRRIYSYRFCDIFTLDSCTVKIQAVTKLHAASKQILKFHAMSHRPSGFITERYKLRHVQSIKSLQLTQRLLWQTFRTPASRFTVCLSSSTTLVVPPPVLWHHLQHNPRL
jgi:hypothetical protein